MPTIQQELMERISGYKPFADVDEALSRLRGLGVKVAVCSNLAQPYGNLVRQFLPGMDAYILSYEVGFVSAAHTALELDKAKQAIFEALEVVYR